MRNFLDLFVRRPRISGAIIIAALIAGVLSALSLPIAFFPTVARPTISVTCTYPGANAREVMNTVAGPLEDRVNGVEGFAYMASWCGDNGGYSLSVYFQAGFDRDLALMKVQAAVQQALTQLPQEVKNTGVTVGIGQNIDLGFVTCYSDKGALTRDEVVDYVYGVVSPALLRIKGVGASSVQDEKIAMRVWLDSDRMSALGISTTDVVAAIKAQNVQASLGTLGASPTEESGVRLMTLVSKGRLHTEEEFGAIIVRTKPDGGLVYLRDIATIGLGHEAYGHSGRFCDKPGCVLHLFQLPGANTFETVSQIKKLLADIEARAPGDLKCDLTVDVTRYSGSALSGAAISLGLAALLALVVLLVAFRSLRMAVVPFLSSLVALALVVTVLAVTGSFITVVSLYALTVSLVFIVGLETCMTVACRDRNLFRPRLCVLVAGVVLAFPSLVLLLVGGVQGLILRQFAVVFAATGVSAALTALTVVPGLAILFRLDERGESVVSEKPVTPMPGAAFVAFGIVLAMALASFVFVSRIPKDLVPTEDFGVVLVDVKTREGTALQDVVKIVDEAYRRILGVCDVEKSCTVFGEGIFSGTGENLAKLYLILKPWSERGPGESTAEIVARIRNAVADIPGAAISPTMQATVPGIGTQAVVSPLVLSVADNDPIKLAKEAHRLQAILKRSPLADSVLCGYNTDAPHLRIHVDRAKCELMNVPLSSLFTTLQHCLGSIYVNDINLGIQVNRVTVMNDWKGRSTPDRMQGLYVRSTTGAMVPVSTLVEYEEELGPPIIYRYNRYIYCTVDMAPKAGVSLTDAMDEVRRVFARELPQDFDTGWVGLAYEEASSPGRMGVMIALSVLAVYLVLLIRFESWRVSFLTILPTVAAVFGAVLALRLTGVSLSLYSRVAILLLIYVNAAFLLLWTPEMPWRRRVVLPLMAAAMALPLVFSSGAGAAGSRSLGIALFGGYLVYAFVGLPLSVWLAGSLSTGTVAQRCDFDKKGT